MVFVVVFCCGFLLRLVLKNFFLENFFKGVSGVFFGEGLVASKLYGVNATIIIFAFVL